VLGAPALRHSKAKAKSKSSASKTLADAFVESHLAQKTRKDGAPIYCYGAAEGRRFQNKLRQTHYWGGGRSI
jgi:hypothetical protein